MKKAVLYVHGKGGSPREAEQYAENCPGFDLYGVDYGPSFPWSAEAPIRADLERLQRRYERVVLIGNSIGAYFAMNALQGQALARALFISPILNMERLILDMLGWAGATEEELQRRGEIVTDFGETLFWAYLRYVRSHPIQWDVPTDILYAGRDNLTSRETAEDFARRHGASLTVMEEGEHWFHTPRQLAFLNGWMRDVMAGL